MDTRKLSNMSLLGKVELEVAASAERMIENVMDWEHLPFVHAETFTSVEYLEGGPNWFRTRLGYVSGEVGITVVTVAEEGDQWTVALEEGPEKGLVLHNVMTKVTPRRIWLDISVYVPELPPNEAARKALFYFHRRQLELIFAQDSEMTAGRQDVLDRTRARWGLVPGATLGTVESVRARVPFFVTAEGRRYWVWHDGEALALAAADCPHNGGLLPCPARDGSERRCPWHGYTFDNEGKSTDGRGLRTRPRMRLEQVGDQVHLVRARPPSAPVDEPRAGAK